MDLKNLVQQMTLEEKAAICTGDNAWQTVPVERLGIPVMTVADGPHGMRRVRDVGALGHESLPATCFPTASALAATWNRALIYEMGQALAEESIAQKVDIVLGPGNNMKRTPLCGRNFEYFSEDPYLGGELATQMILGIQSRGVGTSLKHYAANNQEYRRHSINAQIDERPLREIYLAGFERAVKQGKPWTVMCAYNRVNGPFASQHRRLLTEILRDEWGFEGFVVSDWGAVHDRVAALEAGLDLEMPGPQPDRVQAVVEAVQSGELDEAVLDQAVERLLKIIFRAAETPKGAPFIVDEHHALARRIAGEAIVLLKNEGGLLPLSKDLNKLAVIGAAAKEPYFQGGGSSHVNPTRVDAPLDELAEFAGETELIYAAGYSMQPGASPALIDEAVQVAQQAEAAVLYVALPGFKESEGYDRADMDLTEQEVALIQAVAAVQPQTVVVLNNGSAVTMSAWIDAVPAVLEAWMMGQAGAGAIADVLYGAVNPSGKLAETFPLRLEDTPAFVNFPGENGAVRYGEGLLIGYRYYDARNQAVLFPFGHGLSYTTFVYNNLQLAAESFLDTDGLRLSFDVTNTGDVAGQESVQVYLHQHRSRLVRPPKELKGFAKVSLAPGETQTITIELDQRAFAYYDPANKGWVTESGAFDVLVGASAADIRLQATVQLQSSMVLSSTLTRESTMGEWLRDPRGALLVQPVLQAMKASLGQDTGDDTAPMMTDEGLTAMLDGMPLGSVMRLAASSMTLPEGVSRRGYVQYLLDQLYKDEA